MFYLAAAYSDKDPNVEEKRLDDINRAAGKLIVGGERVFSPLSHGVPIAKLNPQLGSDAKSWEDHNREMLEHCYNIILYIRLFQ